jgi:hypothetical protein
MLLEDYRLMAWVFDRAVRIAERTDDGLPGDEGQFLGLLAVEYDVARRRQVGNFPQAFGHLTLILAARAISSAEAGAPRAAHART